jgi:outer membrane protein TolC
MGVVFVAGMFFSGMGQQPLTLEQCYKLAETNYPLGGQLPLMSESSSLKMANHGKNYLPQINVNGSVSYQSDVTKVDIELPKGLPSLAMPTLSKDWYKLTLDVNQAIYDGHVTSYQKRVEEYNLRADQKGVQAELYKLRERVNQLYFGILAIDQSIKLLETNVTRIEAKIKEVSSAVQNGAAIGMNLDLLKAELIRVKQQINELGSDRATSCRMLGELIGTPVADDAGLILPDVAEVSPVFQNLRPENQLFDIQRERLDVMKNMITTKWNPKVFAFGQAGYGRPGLNMLDDNFRPWYVVGAKMTWNPWNWNINKNEKKILSLQSDILRSQQETFDKNLRINAQKDLGEITKIAGLLAQDREIIDLRTSITRAASSQLDNGVITSSDYIARLNEETQARLNLEIHKLQLVRARVGYLYTTGLSSK